VALICAVYCISACYKEYQEEQERKEKKARKKAAMAE
jgi:Na+-transporting methylmalonyl-CoA/oxaloacetate decarboxylase gamma subunit